MMRLLDGKKVFITGGTSGIGKGIVEEFAKQGAFIVFAGTNAEKGQKVLDSIKSLSGQEHEFVTLNVANTQEVSQALKTQLARHNCFDVVVNCAGITRDKLLMTMKEEDWDSVLDTNLKSVYNVTHALLRPMLKNKSGKIINISSVIGLTGNPGQVNYSASKFGMIGFTKSLAKEVAPKGIQVNAIAPGFIQTQMTDALTDSQKQEIVQRIPMKKLGSVKDIAYAALFLASYLSDYVTGEVVTVDGGMIA